MRIDFISLFPDQVLSTIRHSITGRAEEKGLVEYVAVSPREFARDARGTVDDTPAGGGPGMVMMAEPVRDALLSLPVEASRAVVVTDPTGVRFEQSHARELASLFQVVFVCGHYEGIDDRFRQRYATHSFSLGDFILTGGELPALVMTDAVVRLLPGVLGSPESLDIDAHSDGLLSAPQFTRPDVFEGLEIPAVLKSGDHGAIARWKRQMSLRLTRSSRPDLFARAELGKSDLELL
ncbi:MAG TPA: tRNA (guanosine(37)-N1)-methyltransferase TrmD [Fimbriimonadaceae bacterium]|nr:tRNA (guanosine(37)-N1)-methyltransferase TrmD [Fimbriimonadaceae bacterium]